MRRWTAMSAHPYWITITAFDWIYRPYYNEFYANAAHIPLYGMWEVKWKLKILLPAYNHRIKHILKIRPRGRLRAARKPLAWQNYFFVYFIQAITQAPSFLSCVRYRVMYYNFNSIYCQTQYAFYVMAIISSNFWVVKFWWRMAIVESWEFQPYAKSRSIHRVSNSDSFFHLPHLQKITTPFYEVNH